LKSHVVLNPAESEIRQQIAEQAGEFRAVLAAESRATKLIELLDYLLERSADPRAPKEIEVAMAVFGKSPDFDTSQDSTVRAHIYRLRQRLDSFNAKKPGTRLRIPKGEYRLTLSDGMHSSDQHEPDVRPPRPAPKRAWAIIGLCCLASVMVWTLLWALAPAPRANARQPASALGRTAFWTPIATHSHVPIIAANDFFMAVKTGPDGHLDRLSMRGTIRSPRDLFTYLGAHSDQYGKLHDRDIHRLPATVATGADTVLSLAASVRPDHGMGEILPVSQISQDMIQSRNVIYITYFSQLDTLRAPILHNSGFAPGADFDELKDVGSGKTYRAWAKDAHPENADGYDYGIIASFPGPSGNQILLISGLEDTALTQMVRLVSDQRQLQALSAKVGGAKAFEALFQIRITGGLIFDTKLLVARTLSNRS
jgi:hypothetical protein